MKIMKKRPVIAKLLTRKGNGGGTTCCSTLLCGQLLSFYSKKIWFMLDKDHTLNVRSVYCSGTVLGYPNSIFVDNSYKYSNNPLHLLPRACKFQPKTGRERFFELILQYEIITVMTRFYSFIISDGLAHSKSGNVCQICYKSQIW